MSELILSNKITHELGECSMTLNLEEFVTDNLFEFNKFSSVFSKVIGIPTLDPSFSQLDDLSYGTTLNKRKFELLITNTEILPTINSELYSELLNLVCRIGVQAFIAECEFYIIWQK